MRNALVEVSQGAHFMLFEKYNKKCYFIFLLTIHPWEISTSKIKVYRKTNKRHVTDNFMVDT
jgi:hypothetical protein